MPSEKFKYPKEGICDCGFGILEVVIATAVISVSFFAVFSVANIAFKGMGESLNKVKAGFLLEEGYEAARFMRDKDWGYFSSLSLNVPYFFIFSDGEWRATTTQVFEDGAFGRTVTLKEVLRDSDDNISSAGSLDTDSRKLEIRVFWNERGGEKEIKAASFLDNIFE